MASFSKFAFPHCKLKIALRDLRRNLEYTQELEKKDEKYQGAIYKWCKQLWEVEERLKKKKNWGWRMKIG